MELIMLSVVKPGNQKPKQPSTDPEFLRVLPLPAAFSEHFNTMTNGLFPLVHTTEKYIINWRELLPGGMVGLDLYIFLEKNDDGQIKGIKGSYGSNGKAN